MQKYQLQLWFHDGDSGFVMMVDAYIKHDQSFSHWEQM